MAVEALPASVSAESTRDSVHQTLLRDDIPAWRGRAAALGAVLAANVNSILFSGLRAAHLIAGRYGLLGAAQGTAASSLD